MTSIHPQPSTHLVEESHTLGTDNQTSAISAETKDHSNKRTNTKDKIRVWLKNGNGQHDDPNKRKKFKTRINKQRVRTLHQKTISRLSQQIFQSVQHLSAKYQTLRLQPPNNFHYNPPTLPPTTQIHPLHQITPQQYKNNSPNDQREEINNFFYTLFIIKNILSEHHSYYHQQQSTKKFRTLYRRQLSNLQSKQPKQKYYVKHHQQHLITCYGVWKCYANSQFQLPAAICSFDVHPYYSLLWKKIFKQPIQSNQTQSHVGCKYSTHFQLKIQQQTNIQPRYLITQHIDQPPTNKPLNTSVFHPQKQNPFSNQLIQQTTCTNLEKNLVFQDQL